MDNYRNIAMQWVAEVEHRPAVEAITKHLHANESLHLHDCTEGPEPCSYCWLRAAKAVQAIEVEAGRVLLANRPTVVCLCGSTRFYDAFQQANYDLTMAGKIVLSVGFYPHAKAEGGGHGEGVGHDSAEKVALDELHKRKIDLADEVLVLNVGGYIGESTRGEIEHARTIKRPVRYLEDPEGSES